MSEVFVCTSYPVVDRYITNLRAGLATMPVADQQEVERDIRSHIAEAMAAGTPIDQVLQALGPADALARAYALELLLDDSRSKAAGISGPQRFLTLAGLVALTSIPTIVIVAVLGAVGVSFSVSGLVVALAGIAVAAGLTTIFGQPLVLGIRRSFRIASTVHLMRSPRVVETLVSVASRSKRAIRSESAAKPQADLKQGWPGAACRAEAGEGVSRACGGGRGCGR